MKSVKPFEAKEGVLPFCVVVVCEGKHQGCENFSLLVFFWMSTVSIFLVHVRSALCTLFEISDYLATADYKISRC